LAISKGYTVGIIVIYLNFELFLKTSFRLRKENLSMFVKTLESLMEPPAYRKHRQGGEIEQIMFCRPGLRIRIGSGSGIRIQEGKNDPEKVGKS
jgi:hypothetical protein